MEKKLKEDSRIHIIPTMAIAGLAGATITSILSEISDRAQIQDIQKAIAANLLTTPQCEAMLENKTLLRTVAEYNKQIQAQLEVFFTACEAEQRSHNGEPANFIY